MMTIFIMFIIGSFVASVLVIAAGMMSSRVSQSQPMVEEYEAMLASQPRKKVTPRTYPVEI